MKQKRSGKLLWSAIILFLANVVFFLSIWLMKKYDNVCFDQFLYQIKSSMKGADNSLVLSGFLYMGGFGGLLTLSEIGIYILLSRKMSAVLNKTVLPFVIVCLGLSVAFFAFKFNVVSYIITINTQSDFFEENYIDPENVDLKFPKNKRNLVFIFAESMENAYVSSEDGGQFKENRIPELSDLANQNINFSNVKGLGGAKSFDGTTWTAGGLVSATAGVTVKVPVITNAYARNSKFLDNTVTLGDILQKNGYNQSIVMGSDSEFANRDLYFKKHGNYNILDIKNIKEKGKLPKDYKVWWGYEDEKLFQYAKEEIINLSKQDKPFNMTVLTADTHFPDGYICEDCEKDFDDQYSNVLRCSSKKISDFVDWIKKQPFYDNTTIIIVGDHLTMDPDFLKNIDKSYERTTYNCIINSQVKPVKEKERQFATFDLFPTTLASLGVEIEGDRLGLGTNLFSESETLIEKYGLEYSNREILKKSDYYNKKIFNMN